MPGVPIGPVARHVARLYGEGTVSGLSESQLLDRFLARNDAAAFEALVARHGPMVLAVCRRVLRDPHAADDAFQATFLLLVRKAGSIRGTDLLGPWLHRVAYRVSMRLSKAESRRRGRETPSPEAVSLAAAPDRPGPELRLALHEALDALPEKLRAPVVLCYLEGRTHDEAARRLDWPIGSVKGRLSRARTILKDRLSRRGVLVPSGTILAGLAREAKSAVPALLRDSTVRAASSLAAGRSLASSGAISATAAALTQEAARSMLIKKLGALAASVAALFLMVGGAAVVARQEGKEAVAGATPPSKSGPAPADERPVATAKPADPPSDLDRIQGRWERVFRSTDGRGTVVYTPIGAGPLTEVVIRGDQFFDASANGEPSAPRTLALDPAASPRRFTWERVAAGGAIDRTIGIYKVDDSTFTLCFDSRKPLTPPSEFSDDPNGLNAPFTLVFRRLAALPDPTPDARDELSRLQGTWMAVAQEISSENVSELSRSLTNNFQLQIHGNQIRTGSLDGSFIRLDVASSPHILEIRQPRNRKSGGGMGGSGGNAPLRRLAYKLDDDTLVTCFHSQSRWDEAPTELVTRPNDGRILTVYQRLADPSSPPRPSSIPKADGARGDQTPQASGPTTAPRQTNTKAASSPFNEPPKPEEPPPEPPPPSRHQLPDPPKRPEVNPATESASRPPASTKRPTARKPTPAAKVDDAAGSVADGPTGAQLAARVRDEADRLADQQGASLDRVGDLEDEAERLHKNFTDLNQKIESTEAYLLTGIRFGGEMTLDKSEESMKLLDSARAHRDSLVKRLREARSQAREKRREAERLESEIATLRAKADQAAKRPGKPGTVQVGDILVIEVLEALPGRPISGERVVRPDGTVSLGFYGDVKVEGLTRREIKVKVVEHLQTFLNDESLGLIVEDPGTHKRAPCPPADTDRVFVDDSLNYMPPRGDRSKDLDRKLDEIAREIESMRRLGTPAPRRGK